MRKTLLLTGMLLAAGNVLANNLDGSIASSVLCQPQAPYTHADNIVYENGRIKALTYATVTCPVEVNNEVRDHGQFTKMQVWIRANNTSATSRVQCRLKNFTWKGELELNTPWVLTNGSGYGNATLEIHADYIRRGGQTTMECMMPAYSYIENYQMEPRYSLR
jgi:hypothetical protein